MGSRRKLIVICQSGGNLTTTRPTDGASLTHTHSYSYCGGEAHATSVNEDTKFDDFISEISHFFKYQHSSSISSIKYFLPNNNTTLITISGDKDIQNMIEFHQDSATVDVYVFTTTTTTPNTTTQTQTHTHDHVSATSAAATTPSPCTSFNVEEECTSQTTSSRTTAVEPDSPDNSPVASVADADHTRHPHLPPSWKNGIVAVDQQFNTIDEFRDAFHKYSLAHGFLYKYKSNDHQRVSAKCKADGCPWFILASKLSTTPLFRIRKFTPTHTCGVGTNNLNRPPVSTKLVASLVKDKLQNSPDYRARKIVDDLRLDFGIEVGYMQAYRGLETALEDLYGSHKDAYNQLPWLCQKIEETNPGSVATVVTREDLSFHRLFVSFHASLHGFFNGCRPLLFLDNLPLKSKYMGDLLTASALDGNDAIFPVAFAIVDQLSDDDWHWFLVQLESALQASEPITFVADKKKGTSDALPKIFKNSCHSYCLHHLTENFKDELNGVYIQEVVDVILTDFHNAAHAPTVEGFKKCIQALKHVSVEAYEWVQQSNPQHWANAFFGGARYNHAKSNIAHSFYSWASGAPGLPIVQVVETMRRKIMELFYTRRLDSDEWSSRLTPCSEEKLQKVTLSSRSVEVVVSSGTTYNVRDSLGVMYIVKLDHWDCSCREWQITGLPCLHAVAVIDKLGKNVYDYCLKYFRVENFRLSYSECVNPVPIADFLMDRENSPVRVHPPAIHRSSGRPKERIVQSRLAVKRPLKCSNCNLMGHNKKSCKKSS